MGGTSTDVSRFDGRYELEYETEKAGVRVVAPMMAIETVAAGGGSICRFDGVKLAVGPDSAGADPGPACYGRGGPLTVTDVNFLLGKIPPDRFPFPLDRRAAEARLAETIEAIAAAGGRRYAPLELAEGFVRVANANMAKAIRSISVAKGCDPRDYVLVPFGGAAGQHACAVAAELGIGQILHHPHAGLLERYGIGLADVERHRAAGVYEPLSPALVERLQAAAAELEREAAAGVVAEGIAREQVAATRWLELRYRGVEASLVGAVSRARRAGAVQRSVRRRAPQALRLRARRPRVGSGRRRASKPAAVRRAPCPARSAWPRGRPPAGARGKSISTGGRSRPRCSTAGSSGPAIPLPARRSSARAASTTLVDPLWRAEVLSGGELLVDAARRSARQRGRLDRGRSSDARNLQQPVRRHRRADGHHAAQHVEQRERQGAARLSAARCSRPRATWSSTPRTFPYTWGRWPKRCAR